MCRIERGLGADRRGQQTQYAQTRTTGVLQFELRARLATELTNEQCRLLAFPLSPASVEMRAVARIKSLPKTLKSVYLMKPGLSVRAVDPEGHQTLPFRRYRPDIKVVGDEMIPLMQVKGFFAVYHQDQGVGGRSLC